MLFVHLSQILPKATNLRKVGFNLNRDEAWQIVTEYTNSDSLRKHMLSVEAALRAYAPRFNGEVELWSVVGLLHDFDYERYPDVAAEGHPVIGSRLLRERGASEEIIRAILSHATEVTGVERVTDLEKTLYAVDELTGLITAVALVRPSRSLYDLTSSSVKKKWKDRESPKQDGKNVNGPGPPNPRFRSG